MNVESILSKIGLTEPAAKVYLTCLQLGMATMTEIAKAAGTKRSTTYLIIDDLIIGGFLTVAKKGQKKFYSPEPPSRLLQLLRFRTRELEHVLPELDAIYNEPKQKPKIKIFEGKDAVKNIYDEMYTHLGRKEEALFFTSIADLQTYFPEAITYYVRQLKQKKNYRIRELNIGDDIGIAYVQKMKPIIGKYHQVRLLDPALNFANTDNLIFGDKLVIFSIKQNIFVIVIEHKHIADTYRALFNAAWQMGKSI